MDISLEKAGASDCQLILDMQIAAFEALLQKYRDYNTNPGAEDLDIIKQKMKQDATDYFFICLNNTKIGVIRVVRKSAGCCRISPMLILPRYQGNGYAQQAILQAEALYPGASSWELDTIRQEEKLCYLYEKMGYRPTGREEDIQSGMTVVYYSKVMNSCDF